MRTAARQAAAVRYAEAKRVVEAYEVQVKTRRARWLAAATESASRFALVELNDALRQAAQAEVNKSTAWREWHRLTNG